MIEVPSIGCDYLVVTLCGASSSCAYTARSKRCVLPEGTGILEYSDFTSHFKDYNITVILKQILEQCCSNVLLKPSVTRWHTVIHTDIHTVMEVAAMQSAKQHIRSNMACSNLPNRTNYLPMTRTSFYPWATAVAVRVRLREKAGVFSWFRYNGWTVSEDWEK